VKDAAAKDGPAVRDLAERIERNRFVGREFLLWLWFESQVFETNLAPSGAGRVALWIETRMALAFEKEEAVLKSSALQQSPEAKQALRQGKLPREARLYLSTGEHEFTWVMKADSLGTGSLKIPSQLKKNDDEPQEVLYERMMLVTELETILEALWNDFLSLRLSEAWEDVVMPALRRFAHGKKVDEAAYLAGKQRFIGKKKAKGGAARADALA
jgi:hypothetical protein